MRYRLRITQRQRRNRSYPPMSLEQPDHDFIPVAPRRKLGEALRDEPDLNRYGSNPRGKIRTTRRGGTSTRAAILNFIPKAYINKNLDTSKIIKTIAQPASLSAPEHIPIENTRYVASYNWVDREEPTIVVPGSPAHWTGRDLPFTLDPDEGFHFVDQSGARISRYPMLPLFVAADAIHDKKAPVDWAAVDVITDRNGLRKLLRWLNPEEGEEVRSFRIDVELVGSKTIVLNRWEPRAREPSRQGTFGFGFEAATSCAAPGCPISGHHRTITYDMLDMKMIVRFEVDACLATKTTDTKCFSKKAPAPAVDDLTDVLASISLCSSSMFSSSSSPPETIKIIRAGTQVPQHALLEVASRSVNYVNQLKWNELYPQLALSQTPALRLGVHKRGTFTELHEWQIIGADASTSTSDSDASDVTAGGSPPPDLTAQRRETAAQIVRLARVLKDVQELAILRGLGPAGCFSLVCEAGELRVYKHKTVRSCLPPDVKARFLVPGVSAGVDA